MAEALFGVASKLLVTVGSPAFEKAYEKASSIKNAQKDLKKLEASIGTIHAVLLDAEKKQDSSAAVKNWIKRVRDVLYDADDLFDEVDTDDMLGKLTNGGSKHTKKVRDIFSNYSIAKMVKDIRKRFLEISKDIRDFQFKECRNESPIGGMRKGQDPGLLFIDSEKVIGRDKDKKAILEMLVAESSTDVSVIVVVGIGGMGKTTLAQLVYKDDEVQRTFGKISSLYEVIGKICQSTCGVEKYEHLSIIDLQNRISEKMKGRKFLLVLDDVWDDSGDRWDARMDIWRRGAKGSKVIVTTRSHSVAEAVGASETYHLDGLSEEKSWELFKRVARITPEKERDSRWNDLGREFVRKGANVPLAIRSIASLLAEKNTIEEWELFRNNELPKLGQTQENGIMPVLRLSCDHLASHLKPCFAYCSLFPKDHIFDKDDLIDLWASQGYIKTTNDSQSIEDMEKQFANFKCLRALKLSNLRIEIVPSYIGELKHLRYLDVSQNNFKRLPDAITNLVNLCMLNISWCYKLEVLPNQFSKLVNLRGLLNRGCGLKHMPLVNWDGVDSWKLCPYLQFLEIVHYKGIRMPNWGNGRRTNEAYLLPRLTRLYLSDCSRVKCLPSLRHLPNLNVLTLRRMDELEYIQGDEEEEKLSPNAIFLPDLKKLKFVDLKKLKGWSRKVEEATRNKEEHAATCTPHTLSFPSLSELTIKECPELNHMLLCPSQLLLPIHGNSFPSNTTTPSSSLQSFCTKLNKVELAPLGSNILEELILWKCPELELWEENKRGVDWDSLSKLSLEEERCGLWIGIPSSEKLPDCLRKRQAHFRLTITCLRALSLISLDIETIPSSIGDLKHLRYLDISGNAFRTLPDAFTKLTLDEFRVSKEIDGGQRSKLDVLCSLKLRGELRISFRDETDDWDGVECWKPSPFLQGLWIDDYKGNRIPHWGNKMTDNQASLTTLSLIGCSRVQCLPSFRHLPNVNDLTLIRMYELVYIEGGEEEEENQDPNAIFIPNLKKIYFDILPKLKGWSRKEVAARSKEVNIAARASTSTCPPPPPLQVLSFPSLYAVSIMNCQELSHMLPCPSLQKLTLISVKANLICQFLQPINITPLSSLQFVRIKLCDDLVSFPGESLTSLEHLYIDNCSKLKQVHLAPLHLNILEDLKLTKCPELELWEENERGVQWDSLLKLTELELMEIPSSERLPDCLRLRQELGILKIHASHKMD
ncbi:hypothetical protein V2J09_005402 [Rumex salicifolius]